MYSKSPTMHCSDNWCWLFTWLIIMCTLHPCKMQNSKGETDDLDNPHRDPSMCEVCKFLAEELKGRLHETGKSKEILQTGHGLDTEKKRTKYIETELRLIEALTDPHVCDKILEYNVHAERKGSLRFSKGQSQTMETLHNLVDKGVKVDLGIPYELWDTPSASVTEMQRKCFSLVENYEEEIEDWYSNNQEEDLTKFLCQDRALKSNDQDCLSEVWNPQAEDTSDKEANQKKDEL